MTTHVRICADSEPARENADRVVSFFFQVLSARGAGRAEDFLAADFLDHDPAPGAPCDREGVAQKLDALWAAFPDGHFDLCEVIAAADRVAARSLFRGTHRGTFMGMAASGHVVRVSFSDFYRIDGGLIAEHWHDVDAAGWLAQLQPAR